MSGDEIRDGAVWAGFDYSLQVWVEDGRVLPCHHPLAMRQRGPCCEAARYAGLKILEIPGHQVRWEPVQAYVTAGGQD